jgi:hypothetical protein
MCRNACWTLRLLKFDSDLMEAADNTAACRIKLFDKIAKKVELQIRESNETISPGEKIELSYISLEIQLLNANLTYYESLAREIPFTAMKFSAATPVFIQQTTGVDTDYRLWVPPVDSSISPSSKFRGLFEENSRIFSMSSEAGRRSYLDMFLRDVLAREEFGFKLRLFAEFELSVTGRNSNAQPIKLSGTADYVIGQSIVDIFDKPHPNELQLVAVEAKCVLDRGYFWQCVAEAAALHAMRKERVPDSCEIWGILSDVEHWTFIHIDNHSLLWTSKSHYLNIRPNAYNQSEVNAIYQMIFGIMKSCQTPRS